MTNPQIQIDVDDYWGIGPYTDVYGHGPVTLFNPPGESGMAFAACLDCGYLADDIRFFVGQKCRRETNHINQTWRESIEANEYPEEGVGTVYLDDGRVVPADEVDE